MTNILVINGQASFLAWIELLSKSVSKVTKNNTIRTV